MDEDEKKFREMVKKEHLRKKSESKLEKIRDNPEVIFKTEDGLCYVHNYKNRQWLIKDEEKGVSVPGLYLFFGSVNPGANKAVDERNHPWYSELREQIASGTIPGFVPCFNEGFLPIGIRGLPYGLVKRIDYHGVRLKDNLELNQDDLHVGKRILERKVIDMTFPPKKQDE